MGKTIAIASGKGGTGKTMVSANLGTALSKKGYSVLLADMDTGMRNLDLYLGLENKVVFDVGDVLNDVCSIKQAIIKNKKFPNMFFLPASPCIDDEEFPQSHVRILFEALENSFDYVIVDCPSGREGLITATECADNVILVVNPELSSLRYCDSMVSTLEKKGVKNCFFIVNKANIKLINEGFAPSLREMDDKLRGKIIGIVRDDINIKISTNMGLPVTYIEDSAPSDNFERIAERLVELLK